MLRQQIQADITRFAKEKKQQEVEVLRSIFSAIKNQEIELKRELNDEEIIKILKKYAKDLKEANEMFEAGGRDDLIEQNNREIEIVSVYMPAELSDEEIEKMVRMVLEKTPDEKNVGRLIGLSMKELSGKADGSRVAGIVRKIVN
ncbi:MAG: GatB/YqeY domain-containing protein [Candidatus Roizmanbacteria bacterium]|nr:GatB/YqeY domain-containing protein [Candidatus Roizmanbacteria bacterium]